MWQSINGLIKWHQRV